MSGTEFCSPETGVPEAVIASWHRSRRAGVSPERYKVPFHEDVDRDSRLAWVGRPVLDRLNAELSDAPVTIVLTDAKARIIDRRDGTTSVGRMLDRVDLNPGFCFEEEHVGTNGVGSVLETGAPVSVVGAAHYAEALIPFACIGAPILDPLTGRTEGVLDVSLLARNWTPVIDALVKTTANEIGQELLREHNVAKQALFDAYLKLDRQYPGAVIALGDIVISNQRAQRMFSPEESRLIQEHAKLMLWHREKAAETLHLSSGRQIEVRARRVLAGSEPAGIVITVFDPIAHSKLPHPPSAPKQNDRRKSAYIRNPSSPISEGKRLFNVSPAWEKACNDLREAMAHAEPSLVIGEPGSGRFSLLTETFLDRWPDGEILAVDAVSLSSKKSLELPQPQATSSPTLVVLRDLDRLPNDDAVITSLFADMTSAAQFQKVQTDHIPYLIAATVSTRHVDELPFQRLLHHFAQAIKVPPLRHRSIDLPHLAARILTEIAPARKLQLGAATTRILTSYSWPRNVTQLREALEYAIAQRPVGEIQVHDLPGFCRSSSMRQLTPLEKVERDAIVSALEEHGGNRVRTAESLGMARSSLYRKLKSYAIIEV